MIEIELHNLALNIKEFRKKSKLFQAELVEKLGVARTTIDYYERAEVEPNIYTLIQLSKLMNHSIDSLLGLNHSNETTNHLNNSDLSKKIFILNKLIEKNTQSFNDLETSKLRTERMFNELKKLVTEPKMILNYFKNYLKNLLIL
ncbi:helix-turn-helix domain-containing protein [Clostridium perfringens]|uniref:helix-turn-helix domain-containing protein n=1 Tax=Clostridium perfringens TaxID=1502 RepID=UPI001FB0C236|nr:helix-turn-helix transcriptional regulator [Clostridium perfringens]